MYQQDLSSEDLQKAVRDLTSKVKNLEIAQNKLSNAPALDRNLDNQSKDILAQEVSSRIMDIVWDKYFYYHNFFESLDGWSLSDSGASTGVTGSGVTLHTGTISGDETGISKQPLSQRILSWDYESRFRTAVRTGQTSNYQFWICVGWGISDNALKRYGFRFENDKLYAVCADGTTETKKQILTITNAVRYNLEARFFPNSRVDFYASDGGESELKYRTSISENLPSGSIGTDGDSFWITSYIKTAAATGRFAFMDFVEYIQVRPTL